MGKVIRDMCSYFKDMKMRRDERGASLVEFAFIAPFLILLLLGIIEFGYLLC